MNKEALLQETYDSAFNDELEKIAKMSPIQKTEKKLRNLQRAEKMNEEMSVAEKTYAKDIKPYSKYRSAVKGGGVAGAALGALAGLAKGKLRGVRLAGGVLAGGLIGPAAVHQTLGFANPKYKKAFEDSTYKYYKSLGSSWDKNKKGE